MDFGTLPPEISTARMYSGPGTASLLNAATTWQRLADHLHEAATKYLVSAGLLDGLRGPAAVQMGDTTAPYVAWLHATAASAEQTAARAGAAADAYEWALAATAPPQTIVANRGLRRSLAATNHLRQNTPAIAAAEGHYDQLWAQNAAAMYAYAAAAAAASTVPPFTSPPAAGDGNDVISAVGELISMLPAALNGLSSASYWRFRTAVLSMSSPLSKLSSLRTGFVKAASVPLAVAIGGAAANAVRGNRAAALAGLGRAIAIGGLSVPPAWQPVAKPDPADSVFHSPDTARRAGGQTHTGL